MTEEAKEQGLTTEDIKRRFPECTAIVDEFRAVFGPGVRPRYFKEGDHEMGRPSPPGVPVRLLGFCEPRDETEPETKPKQPTRQRWKDMAR